MEFHVKTIHVSEARNIDAGHAPGRKLPAVGLGRQLAKVPMALIVFLLSIGGASAGECPLLVEPDRITASTPVTANWTSGVACLSDPAVEISGSVVTVDFNFGYCPGVLPPGVCGDNRALIGRLPPGMYTLVAIGHDTQRQVNFEVLPVAIPGLNAIGIILAVALFLGSAFIWLIIHSSRRQRAGGVQR